MGWLDDVIADGIRNAQRSALEEAMRTGRAPTSTSTRVPIVGVDRGTGPSVTVESKIRISNCRVCWGTGKMWCYVGMKCPFCEGTGAVKSVTGNGYQ